MNKNKKDRGGDGKFIDGSTPWNKNRRIHLDLVKIEKQHKSGKSILDIAKDLKVSDRLIRIRLKENGLFIRKNTVHSKQTKQKIKQTMKKKGIHPKKRYSGKPTSGCFKKGGDAWNKGKVGVQISTRKGKNFEELYGEEKARNIIHQIKENRKHQTFPLKDSTIEIKIQDFLTALKIEFMTHKYMNIKYGYQCDIFIPRQEGIHKKTVIECDGDYWHGNLNVIPIHKLPQSIKEKRCLDYERTAQLEEAGFNVIRLWESEIKPMKLNDLKNILK